MQGKVRWEEITSFFIALTIRFHIVRHSNEDNIENGITLHHHDEAEQHKKNCFFCDEGERKT